MAAAFIPVDNSKLLAHSLLEAATVARDFANRINALKRVMDAQTNGSDYSVLEAQFGLPAGKGGDVSYLISVLKTSLDGVAQFALLPDWFGQV